MVMEIFLFNGRIDLEGDMNRIDKLTAKMKEEGYGAYIDKVKWYYKRDDIPSSLVKSNYCKNEIF